MKPEIELQWQKGRDGWIPLDRLNIQSKFLNDVFGIYILWAGNDIVKIGKGKIRDGLIKDKTNKEITGQDGLMVTWCEVQPDKLDNILRYLTSKLKPSIADGPLIVSGLETSVNEPWHENFI